MHIILLKKKQSVKQTNRPISGPIRSDPVIRPDPVNTRTKNWQSFSYIRRTCGEMGGGGGRSVCGPCIHRIGPNHRIGPDRARNWLVSSFLKHFIIIIIMFIKYVYDHNNDVWIIKVG